MFRISAAALALLACLPVCGAGGLSFQAIDAEPLGRVPAGAVVLHDGWSMREEAAAGNDGTRFSSAAFDAPGWYATSVPTTVLGALVRHGVYPDPYVGRNNELIPDASAESSPWRKPWWFRRKFEVPPGYGGKTVWLHLDGINYRAAVWVNGKQVADERSTVGMFRRFRFDITRLVHGGGGNALAIRIFPVDYPGTPGYRRAGTDAGFQRNVTQLSALGWDWVPPARDRNMGIWQHVWIEASGPVAVWDPAAFTALELPSCTEAAITLKFQLENVASSPVEAEVVVRIGSTPAIEVRRKVTLRAGALEEVVLTPAEFPALRMQNPRLWWPRGYGGQPLYRLTVEVRRNGAVSHRQVTRFGVRQLGYFYHPSEYARTLVPTPDGQDPYKYPPMKAARVFTVNGRPIRMAGGSIVPDFLLSWSAQRYRDEVRLMAEGNHTVIRIWGGGLIMPDAFYDEADRRGMLVWQDMARSSFEVGWRKKEAELPPVEKDLYLANMRDSILRLRGRTSLLVWCGTNEAAMQTDIGKALQDEMLPALDPTRPWLPSSSTEPPWAKEPLGVRSFGPYVLQDLQYYFEQYARSPDFLFKDEIGLESVPRYNSIAKAIPDLGGSGGSGSWITPALLDHGLPEKSLGTRMADRVGQPAGLADFVSMSELLSAQGMRAIVEAANKNRPRNPGTMFWMSNAGWLDCMYQLYDWYLHPTAGYYAVKSAARPLHVQYTVDDGTLQVVSTLAGSRPVRIHATLVSPEGRTEAARDYEVTAQADATTMVGPAPAEIGDGSLHFLRLDLRDREGRELDRLVTWTQKEERWGAMLHMPAVRVNANVLARSSLRGEAQYRILVRNEGSVPALHVWVEVIKGAQGEEVLPSFWSDNALTMMPGEERELTVRFREAQLQGATPRIMVEGFNVIPREINAAPLAIEVRDLTYEGRGALKIVCSQTGAAGPRWTTWPLAISVDGRLIRYLRVAVKTGVQSTVRLNLQLARGAHRVEAGGKVIEIPAERS